MCRVSAKDSGKPMVDAAFGEVIVTCEKLWWLIKEGERYLKPEARSASYMVRNIGDVAATAAGAVGGCLMCRRRCVGLKRAGL